LPALSWMRMMNVWEPFFSLVNCRLRCDAVMCAALVFDLPSTDTVMVEVLIPVPCVLS